MQHDKKTQKLLINPLVLAINVAAFFFCILTNVHAGGIQILLNNGIKEWPEGGKK
jgi:hypothetical protein